MLLYVWISSWEIECCQPHAVVGERWGGSIYLDPVEPWWSEYATAGIPEPVLALGVSEFEGEVTGKPGHAQCSLGSASIGITAPSTPGRQQLRGRLVYDGHGVSHGDSELWQGLQCDGVVRRVRGLRFVYEQRGNGHYPIAQEPPVGLDSTHEVVDADDDVDGFHEYLVDLEVD